MFNKNDPLIGAVTGVMKENELRRRVEANLCEELGIYSRKVLPREHQVNYDALLEQRIAESKKGSVPTTDKEKSLAKLHGNPKRVTHGDVLKGRGVIEEKDEETHEIEFADKPGQKFTALGKAPKTHEIEFADKPGQKFTARLADNGRMDEEEDGEETREGGAVVDTKTNKPVVSTTAPRAEPSGPTSAQRDALTNKIKQMKEAMLAGPETGSRKTPGSNQVCEEEQIDEAAKSKAQQRIMGMALAMQRGKSDIGSRTVARIAADMPPEELEKFAKTKHKGLPVRVKKVDEMSLAGVMEEIKKRLGEAKMKELEEEQPEELGDPANRAPAPAPTSQQRRRATADQVGNNNQAGAAQPASAAPPPPSATGSGSSTPAAPAPTPTPAPQSPAQQGARNIRQALDISVGRTQATGPKAGEVPSPVSRENQQNVSGRLLMPADKAPPGSPFSPSEVARQLSPVVKEIIPRSPAARSSADADAFTPQTIAAVASQEKMDKGRAAAAGGSDRAARPQVARAAPTPAAPTARAARPQVARAAPTPVAPAARAENPYEKYGANEPDAGPAAFFRADKEAMAARSAAARPASTPAAARPAAGPVRIRESLETTIKNMLKD